MKILPSPISGDGGIYMDLITMFIRDYGGFAKKVNSNFKKQRKKQCFYKVVSNF